MPDAQDIRAALQAEAVHVEDGNPMRIRQAHEQLRAVGRELHAFRQALDIQVIEQPRRLVGQIEDGEMAVGLMHQARAVLQAAEHGKLAAEMHSDSFDAIGDLGDDLGHGGWLAQDVGEKHRGEDATAAVVPAVGNDNTLAVAGETAGEGAVLLLLWMDADARRSGHVPCFDFGLFAILTFPLSLAWYCFWSRRWRGLLVLLLISALWLAPYVAATVYWLVLTT